MSEGNALPNPNFDDLDSAAWVEDPGIEAGADETAEESWEVVPLPGFFTGDRVSEARRSHVEETTAGLRESRLLAHIRDLNQCNEVLLARVNQLEETLETTQYALQQEVERSQRSTEIPPATSAQTHSVAQLLSELEQANIALERQIMLSHTLEAQLQSFQERSQHLERECAVLRKQYAETLERLEAAEASCTDLRSRLQRQQQFTLQFKVALEKSLAASSHHSPARIADESLETLRSIAPPNPLMMPRAEKIQPWSAATSHAPADQQLLSLIRPNPPATSLPSDWLETSLSEESLNSDSLRIEEPATSSSTADDQAKVQELWQAVEQVMDSAIPCNPLESSEILSASEILKSAPDPEVEIAETQEIAKIEIPEVTQSILKTTADEPTVLFTEPIPWGNPVAASGDAIEPAVTSGPTEPATPLDPVNAEMAAVSPTVAARSQRPPTVPDAYYRQTDIAARVTTLQTMQMPQTAPSPIVHPLRPPTTKRKSLSAVELPSFPRLPKPQLAEPPQATNPG
jgi:hypothetical protein